MNERPLPALESAAGKYLTFRLGDEAYGIAVLKIREIIGLQKITPVPQMPPHARGVINLRGKVIPVVDLRRKFHLDEAPETERTCIIVVQAQLGDGDVSLVGLIVDAVEEVTQIAAGEIEPKPDMTGSGQNTFILGLAKSEGSVKTLLDIEQLLSEDLLTTGVLA